MARPAGYESRCKIRLVRRDRILTFVPLAGQYDRLRLWQETRRILNRGNDGSAMGSVVPRLIPQCHIAVDVVLDASGVAGLFHLVCVISDAAVEVPRVHGLRGDDGGW